MDQLFLSNLSRSHLMCKIPREKSAHTNTVLILRKST